MCSAQEIGCLSYYLWPEGQDEDEEITDEQMKALHQALRSINWGWENQ